MKKKRMKSPVPLLVSAAVLVVWAIYMPMYYMWHYLAAAALSVVLGILTGKLFKGKTYETEAPQQPQQKTEADPAQEAIDEGRERLKDLRRLNSLIDDEKISAQIDQMENIAGRIFDYVSLHRGKLKDIRRFLNYYLPTSIKLLRTYDDLSCQGIDGSNINGTMRNIEEVMDTIVIAYQKQLDSLFADQALDISTDITVLEGILASENLKDNGFKSRGAGK